MAAETRLNLQKIHLPTKWRCTLYSPPVSVILSMASAFLKSSFGVLYFIIIVLSAQTIQTKNITITNAELAKY